jgi:REP element-mobilizing transposase RayT
VVKGLLAELESLPPERRDAERRKRLEAWLDAGHGGCALRNPAAAACVVETWKKFAPERYDLIAWVVMPNHAHVLIRVREGWELGMIVQSWKIYTGRRINELRQAGAWRSQRVWMREYWDRYIRTEGHFAAVVEYIHQNPVKAGFVARAEDWIWSSAREWSDLPLSKPISGEIACPGGALDTENWAAHPMCLR